MIRKLARGILTLAFAGSLALTVATAARVASDPALTPVRAATTAEIVAATDRMMAQEATPERLSTLIRERLDETPRNWIALDALVNVVQDRSLALPPDLMAEVETARADDASLLTRIGDCAKCVYDPATCSFSNVLICQPPVILTPVGDIAGITRAGVDYSLGNDVDRVDLGLSVVGLAATAFVVASGGSSVAVKAGASVAKLARRMGRLSQPLEKLILRSVRNGVDWAVLPSVRSVDELTAAIRMDAFAPIAAVAGDLERLRKGAGSTGALHLLPLVDDAADARHLADAAEALGPRLVGRAEVLGKARLFRATLRIGETAWMLTTGIIGMMLSIASLLGGLFHSLVLRSLRRAAR
jgi:hypothetical protein